jgi:EAL domain-containing protein (putative c-di-GMP-specific phosphodiesterase class I)
MWLMASPVQPGLETLAALGCERVQGFLLAWPMSVDELATLLRSGG